MWHFEWKTVRVTKDLYAVTVLSVLRFRLFFYKFSIVIFPRDHNIGAGVRKKQKRTQVL